MTDFATRRTFMVDTQVRPSDVTKFPVIDALLKIQREAYVPDAKREAAYVGDNLDLGEGRVVLEARTLAKILDALDIQRDEVVLDIGCGLGYSSAIVAQMAEAVVAVEESQFADEAQTILSEQGVDNVAVVEGELRDGATKSGPYDVILLQGSVEAMPKGIEDQLEEGGRIACIWQEGALGVVRVGYKLDGRVHWRFSFNASAPVLPGFEKHSEFTL